MQIKVKAQKEKKKSPSEVRGCENEQMKVTKNLVFFVEISMLLERVEPYWLKNKWFFETVNL